MTEVTDDQLRAWAEAANNASPGPWEALPSGTSFAKVADAYFAAIAREAVPALIGELTRLREIHRALVKAVAEDRSRRVLVAGLAAQTLSGAIRYEGDQRLSSDRVADDAVELAEAICKRLGL